MAINERLVHTASAGGSGAAEAEQGLILHLDANDVDSYDGDGSIWYDISEYDVTIPLSDNADDLELHLNASDTTSYGGTGTTWTDISGNSRNASFQNMTASDFDKDIGGYFDFAGGTQYMTVPHDTTLDASSDNWTFEAWVTKDVTSSLYIASKSATSSGGYGWRLQYGGTSAGYQLFAYNTSNTRTIINTGGSGGATDTGEWHHIAFTWDGTNWKSYFNGEHRNTSSMSGTMSSNTDNLEIGRDGNSNNNEWNGKISAVRIYSKALSASEIGQNYRHGRDIVYTDLMTDKNNFVAGSIETTNLELDLDANDYSGSGNWLDGTSNNNDGTITGATYVNNGSADYFNFDGSNDEVSLNSGNTISASTFNNCTFEYWIKLDNLLESRHLYIHDYTSNNANFIGLSKSNTNNKLMVFGSSGHINIARGNTDLVANKWTHIAVTLTSSELKIYIDGELDATVSQSFNGFSNPLYGTIGNDRRGPSTAGTKWLNGQVGQLRLYSSALTQAQIKSNYDATRIYNAPELNLHLDAASFDGSTNTPSTWTALTGSNGTISGATFDSELGNWLDFDGSNDYVEIGSASSLIPAGSNFSVEVWVNAKSNTENKYWGVVSATNGTSPYGGWMIYNHYTADNWGISMNKSGTWTSLDTGVSIVANKWEHLVYTYDGSNMKLYVNGELRFNSSQSGSLQYNSGSQNIYIGRNEANYAPVKVGQLRLYSSALAQDQIRQNYNFTKPSYPNGYNGTINGSSFLPGTSGEVDAFDFNGSNNSVSLNSSAFSQNIYTIAAWFKLDTLNLGGIFEWGDATSYERRGLIVWNGGSGNYKLYSSSYASNVPANTNLAANVWYHGAVTMDNGSASLYLNGQPDGTGTNTLATYTGTTAYVGRTQVGEYLNGKVSEVKVYNKVLTASEIQALYNEGNG